MKITIALALLLAFGVAIAQSVSPTTASEINHLFAALENSKCEFYRNGSWYGAQKASAHLHQKYEYLVKSI